VNIFTAHHLGLSVSDMGRALRFFGEDLGMRVLMEREIVTPWVTAVNGLPAMPLKIAFLDGYGLKIELLEFGLQNPPSDAPSANLPGTVHLAFLVDNLDEAVAELTRKRVPLVAAPETNADGPNAGSRVVFVMGPDGLRVELVQPPPGRPQIP
jgi:catechol 2,3-dioxygenase-like lactoylglutathione lyase family enzyme